MIGPTVAHYRITATLGEGGNGRSAPPHIQSSAAKLLSICCAAFAADAGRIARCEREAKILASLRLTPTSRTSIGGVEGRLAILA